MEHVDNFKAALTAVLALLTALWGWFGWLVVAWVFAMALDYATGSVAALRAGQWSSKAARDGLLHKAGSIATVMTAGLLDLVVGLLLDNLGQALPIKYTVLLCPLAIVWYLLTEAGSIVENAGELGANIPPWLRKAIATLKNTVDQAADPVDNDNTPDPDNQ